MKAREILETHRPVLIDAETDARIRGRYVIHLPPVWRRGGGP